MNLINLTSKKIISHKLQYATSFVDLSLGLLVKEKGTALVFKTRWGIHTFGMKYSIDVIVLDQQMKVVKLKKNLQPNRIFFWNPLFNQLIEISSSEKIAVKLNDVLQIK